MRHYIITGASRGIGKEVALLAAQPNVTLHLIARSNQEDLKEQLKSKGAEVFVYSFDLSDTEQIEGLVSEIIPKNIDFKSAKAIYLINNAGMLEPMGPIGKYAISEYRKNLELNFVAPSLLCHEFIKYTNSFKGIKRILNVSSGAALNPYHGWSHYCSTKAGLDMMTRCIALEHAPEIGCAGYNPGRTDTAMQEIIRNSSEDDFMYAQSFVDAYEQGKLNPPEKVAQHMLDVLHAAEYPNGENIRYKG